jgi:hypothetical protein
VETDPQAHALPREAMNGLPLCWGSQKVFLLGGLKKQIPVV